MGFKSSSIQLIAHHGRFDVAKLSQLTVHHECQFAMQASRPFISARSAVVTYACTYACSVTLGHLSSLTSTSVSTWMGDHQGRPSAVNLCPFVGVEINLWPTVHIAVIADTDVNQSINRKCEDYWGHDSAVRHRMKTTTVVPMEQVRSDIDTFAD